MSACEICGGALTEIPGYGRLRRMTSDCRPFAAGGALYACTSCGGVQKRNDASWRDDCARIYAAYDSYGLSAGVEQSVRSADGAALEPRSEIVLRRLKASLTLPRAGRLLDFGCGRGVTARAVALALPGWVIDGFDQDDRARAELAEIAGFEMLYTGDPAQVPAAYDMIVLMHALEHIADPSAMLARLAGKLRPDGCIVCQVPDRRGNPYDLLVADHLMHFDADSLLRVAKRAGTHLVTEGRAWIPKELTLVLSPVGLASPATPALSEVDAAAQVDWLRQVAQLSVAATAQGSFCIFGTSVVATWLASELPRAPALYLDEDPAKIGRSLEGVPIVQPDQAPAGSTVLLALAPATAAAVAQRFAGVGVNFVMPPPYPPA
jgi:SAM-dependent methyltransferase